jgi:hypothetical protein
MKITNNFNQTYNSQSQKQNKANPAFGMRFFFTGSASDVFSTIKDVETTSGSGFCAKKMATRFFKDLIEHNRTPSNHYANNGARLIEKFNFEEDPYTRNGFQMKVKIKDEQRQLYIIRSNVDLDVKQNWVTRMQNDLIVNNTSDENLASLIERADNTDLGS